MDILITNHKLTKTSLFVFAGSEELSYDQPIYWGHGYREFEKKYFHILQKAKDIFVVDCVGNGKTLQTNRIKVIKLAFPINNSSTLKKKITIISGNIDDLMKVYHSNTDTIENLNEEYLDEAVSLLKNKSEYKGF